MKVFIFEICNLGAAPTSFERHFILNCDDRQTGPWTNFGEIAANCGAIFQENWLSIGLIWEVTFENGQRQSIKGTRHEFQPITTS